MNYYKPRQMKNPDGSPGKWHYTRMNDGVVWPTGYCAADCPGHDTPEEACKHQAEYDADNTIYDRFSYVDDENERHRKQCEVPGCETYTPRFARIVGGTDVVLCDEHRNREGMIAAHTPGEVWSSY